MLDFGGAIVIGILIHQLKRSFYLYTCFHSLFDMLFIDQLAFMAFIPESFCMVLMFLTSSHPPQRLVCREAFVLPCFLQRTRSIHGSDTELPSLQFQNQKFISKNVF